VEFDQAGPKQLSGPRRHQTRLRITRKGGAVDWIVWLTDRKARAQRGGDPASKRGTPLARADSLPVASAGLGRGCCLGECRRIVLSLRKTRAPWANGGPSTSCPEPVRTNEPTPGVWAQPGMTCWSRPGMRPLSRTVRRRVLAAGSPRSSWRTASAALVHSPPVSCSCIHQPATSPVEQTRRTSNPGVSHRRLQ
jgi:hypothetical protein